MQFPLKSYICDKKHEKPEITLKQYKHENCKPHCNLVFLTNFRLITFFMRGNFKPKNNGKITKN